MSDNASFSPAIVAVGWMRLKPPRLINLAAAVSLLLAVAIVALWVRNYARNESIYRHWRTSTELCNFEVESGHSSLSFSIMHLPDNGPPIAPSYGYRDYHHDTHPYALHWFPFPPARFWHFPLTIGGNAPVDVTELTVAYWLLLPPTLVLPAIALVRHRRRRRRAADNLCPTCGYDLRAHNAGDRCPECGTSIQSTRGSCATQS